MPSQTFYRLSDEKKKRIYNAMYEELLRVPFPEMSINQVVKLAGIPRGSFYQYFENKEDAFDYFVNESFKRVRESVYNRVCEMHGDIYEKMEMIFYEMANAVGNKLNSEIVPHVIPFIEFKKIDPLNAWINAEEKEITFKDFSILGIANLDIKSEEELFDILSIIEALIHKAIPPIVFGTETVEEATKNFNRRLRIIKKATAVKI